MNWEAIGAIGEVVGALGVISTLLYLAMQIRQNTKATDQQTLRDTTEFMYSSYLPVINDEVMADINVRGLENYYELSRVEQERFHYLKVMELHAMTGILGLRGSEDTSISSFHDYVQRRMGKLGYRQWWKHRGQYIAAKDYVALWEQYYESAENQEKGT